jgi:excisionase family DNA binding protein
MTIPTKPQPQAPGPNPSPDEALALPLLMKIDEVMRTLAISRRTVYALIKDGTLHLVRVGIRGSRIR